MKLCALFFGMFLSLELHAKPDSIQEAWQGISDPAALGTGFTHRLSKLPKIASVDQNPYAWSGSGWVSKMGGINFRWNSIYVTPFYYQSPSLRELRRYRPENIAALSPTEKYDIFMGRYDYPLKQEVFRTVSPEALDWEGICHGWAPASLNHPEPIPVYATNKDGITVTFGSSDIKALLSYYYAAHTNTDGTTYAGLRCNFGRWVGGRNECDQDLNAGAFHIIISNLIGLRKEGIVADLDRYNEIWNHPLVAYLTRYTSKFRNPSPNAAANAYKEVTVETRVFYVDGGPNSFLPLHGTPGQQIGEAVYRYTLELDAAGNIVGGEWLSKRRPDFLWKKPKVEKFEGLLFALPRLLLAERPI